MTTHFFGCKITTPPNEIGMMLGKLFGRIHGILALHQWTHVGVSFPALGRFSAPPLRPADPGSVGKSAGSSGILTYHPGDLLCVFSDQETVETIRNNEGIQFLERTGGVTLGSVGPVPDGHPVAVFKRLRKPEKASKQAIAKSEQKLIEHWRTKGAEIDPALLQARRTKRERLNKERKPFIRMNSGSTSRGYSLFLEKYPAEHEQDGTYNTYGLSGAKPKTVPDFPPTQVEEWITNPFQDGF